MTAPWLTILSPAGWSAGSDRHLVADHSLTPPSGEGADVDRSPAVRRRCRRSRPGAGLDRSGHQRGVGVGRVGVDHAGRGAVAAIDDVIWYSKVSPGDAPPLLSASSEQHRHLAGPQVRRGVTGSGSRRRSAVSWRSSVDTVGSSLLLTVPWLRLAVDAGGHRVVDPRAEGDVTFRRARERVDSDTGAGVSGACRRSRRRVGLTVPATRVVFAPGVSAKATPVASVLPLLTMLTCTAACRRARSRRYCRRRSPARLPCSRSSAAPPSPAWPSGRRPAA